MLKKYFVFLIAIFHCPSFVHANLLEDYANDLNAGEWVDLPSDQSLLELPMSYALHFWADSGTWDPVNKRIIWMGGPGSCCGNPPTYQLMIYELETDTWTIAATPYALSGHGYDGNAYDSLTENFYFSFYGQEVVKKWNDGKWSELPPVPYSMSSNIASLEWFPEANNGKGALMHFGCFGKSSWFDGTAWHDVSKTEMGIHHTFAQYNPVHKIVWFRGSDNRHFVIDPTFRITELKSVPPVDLNYPNGYGDKGGWKTVDPISGKYLYFSGLDNSIWEFDVLLDSWNKTALAKPIFHSGSSGFTVPIPEYGVNFVLNHYWTKRGAQLYKHRVVGHKTN
ncbi:MAG: hypothetical protein ACI915_003477 [Gammaproteobacteria bacterium]|jgi:hypothetical protein